MNTFMALKPVHRNGDLHYDTGIKTIKLHVWFGKAHVLQDIDARFESRRINCILGPSGSGKSTLIRCINRMNDETTGFRVEGAIHLDGRNILSASEHVVRLRTKIGMVFQKPCVFPKSIAENVLFGIQHQRKLSGNDKVQIVKKNLKAVSLWREVRHRLHDRADSLSLGQQQRLCIARTLAIKPSIILLDEPTSSLDPVSSRAIEELMVKLKQDYTIVFVTHNIQQAQRIADHLIFMCDGRIIEQGEKEKLFYHPDKVQTKEYLNEEYCEC